MKKDTHPDWFPNAEVICDGEVVMTIGSTKQRITVDIWSGTHPFFTGEARLIDTEGQVDRFMRRLQAREERRDEEQDKRKKRDPRRSEIGVIGLDTRAENALGDAGYITVGDLANALREGEDVLLAVQGVGQKALIDIRRHLRTEGLID